MKALIQQRQTDKHLGTVWEVTYRLACHTQSCMNPAAWVLYVILSLLITGWAVSMQQS